MRRLLAIIGAVAMIGGAFLLRGVITDDGNGGGSGNGGGGSDDGTTHLICVPELEAACEALAAEDNDLTFDVEDAGVTAATLTDPEFRAGESDIDGWLTLNPWSALVDLRRQIDQLNPVLGESSAVLATTPLDLVGFTDRIDGLREVCGAGEDVPIWRCLGDNAGAAWSGISDETSWGEVEVGHADPTTSATGLLVLGQAAGEYFEAFDGATFARNDFDIDPDFREWLQDLEASGPRLPSAAGSPLDQLLQFGESSWDAVGDINWAADEKVAGSRAEDQITVTYSSFMLAEAVAVPLRGHELPDFTESDFRSALTEAGFENPTYDTDPATTISPISAGVYQALIEAWEQAT